MTEMPVKNHRNLITNRNPKNVPKNTATDRQKQNEAKKTKKIMDELWPHFCAVLTQKRLDRQKWNSKKLCTKLSLGTMKNENVFLGFGFGSIFVHKLNED